MQFNLCGKSYDAKMTLAAMKMFNERTDKDLWFTLISVLHSFNINIGKDALTTTKAIVATVDALTAAELLYCLAKTQNRSLGIEEFEDAICRCGWMPHDDENGSSVQPYTLLLVDVAQQVDAQLHSMDVKKKELTGSDATEKES